MNDSGTIYRCGAEGCIYNNDGECMANDVEINYQMTASGLHPVCETYEEE